MLPTLDAAPASPPPTGRNVARATWTAWLPAAAQAALLILLAVYAATAMPGGFWHTLGTLLPALLVLGAASAGLWWWSRRRTATQLDQAVTAIAAIGEGRFQRLDARSASGELAPLLRTLQATQDKLALRLDVMEQGLRHGQFVIKALDDLDTMIRIADDDGQVLFANRKLLKMLKLIEPDVQSFRPSFHAEGFVGGSIGDIYPDSQAAIDRMRALTASKAVRAPFFGRQIDFIYSPIIAADGTKLGTIAQWMDVTAQVNAEQALIEIIDAAAAGDFSRRMQMDGMDGVLLSLAQGINRIYDSVETHLAALARVISALAEGDLTQRVDGDAHGIFARLRDDTNQTVIRLTEIIGGIQTASDTIRRAAVEIAAGNTDLSERTEQQAASLEETASSMEELTSTVKQNADSAQQANKLVLGTGEVAQNGGQVMDDVVSTMSQISTASRKIGEIIGVIDGIAFQTNILALNAAVEAARAGEQGRGFAVVASEVRALARRSADAAKEIKSLIADSTDKVELGSGLVHRAGATMREIVGSVKHVTDIMSEITSASAEQSSGIEQVNRTVAQLDEVTQRNAALVEEATAAARSLEEQAVELADAVSIFRLQSDTRGSSNVVRGSFGSAAA
ncbi:methyl-accepting chemotaxis protein [Xanthomonas campestris pv. campestris]|uniref:methyl-accepting chemotaxis protein n=1 Tax=Xanthomonas campestris TaxID=339 RepID=UPI002378EB5D|nr:methyl-accepting chemotaxis protein [Xanthomonas campestris]MDM7585153.1 methyl-accepting chemotaxis protein [Xanthomonas campestris]MDM7592468.1 methyl-accepting chemotaxis protein [Xanthomonas campestris]MEA9864181.1 methyl-accepting chemotaxis protein [Xanthomonas campestris pv. raphani]WDK59161.1 methyl-accepting chemotaxis protein [Xanthomonas campestris pv. campestris]WDK61934.1 methyl-accepting chemotaxis protein [Xanthomonas campestris pv. campestris]